MNSNQGFQHFSTIMCTKKVQTVQCTHSYVKRWKFCTPCFKIFFLQICTPLYSMVNITAFLRLILIKSLNVSFLFNYKVTFGLVYIDEVLSNV